MSYELCDETKVQVCLSATQASYLLDLIDKQLQHLDNKAVMQENLKAIKDKLNDAMQTAILIM